LDRLHLGRVHGYSTLQDDVAKVGDRCLTERALALFDSKLVLTQNKEDEPNMLQVLGPCAIVYQNIVKEHKHELSEVGTQHVIHQHLECKWGVGHPKRHDQELEVAVVCTDRCLGDVVRVHQCLVLAIAEVELGE
jgi:hypothetical protein